MYPQWPRVVSATMLQYPSNRAAAAGSAEQIIAEAANKATLLIRLPIIGDLTGASIRFVRMARSIALDSEASPKSHRPRHSFRTQLACAGAAIQLLPQEPVPAASRTLRPIASNRKGGGAVIEAVSDQNRKDLSNSRPSRRVRIFVNPADGLNVSARGSNRLPALALRWYAVLALRHSLSFALGARTSARPEAFTQRLERDVK